MGVKDKCTVLAIDDDAVTLNSINELLKETYNVRPFPSWFIASKFLERNNADIILLDCNMPDISGLEVLDLLKSNEKTSQIPVIFLTGTDDSEAEVEALEKGAVDYVLKPIRPNALLIRLYTQLELAHYRNELEDMVRAKTAQIVEANDKLLEREDLTLDLLAKASELRDNDTGKHIMRTTRYVKIITDELVKSTDKSHAITPQKATDIIKASKLHDIGKISIPDNVLLKQGRLNPYEYETIKKHTTAGGKLLRETKPDIESDPLLLEAYNIAIGHHEWWNGSGYPCKLSRENIPLSARIVAIADVYDALVTERPYKKPFSHEEAVSIIMRDAGKHFDPKIAAVFHEIAPQFMELLSCGGSSRGGY